MRHTTRRAAANDDAREETCRLVLRQRLADERSRGVDRFVRADAVSSAARELGRLRSRRAIPAWLSGYEIRPGGAARQLLVPTKDRIVHGAPSYIDDDGAALAVLVV